MSSVGASGPGTRRGARVLGAFIDAVDHDTSVRRILDWARRRESRYVCICNVHVVVTASREAAYLSVIDAADLATPDGAPVAWMMRRLGHAGQRRVAGPDLTERLCREAPAHGVTVFFLGSTEQTLSRLRAALAARFPDLIIAGMESPPFRPLTVGEDQELVKRLQRSGAGLVFVGLGCPKQEQWMAAHRGRVDAVMIGVGAAFDFLAGTVPRAPRWMQEHGLEWLHRLVSEPRRLWRRYLVTNSRFVLAAMRQLLANGRGS